MPIREMPQYKSVPDKMLDISQPAIGGLNLRDLEFEQDVTQSPYMLNMMYRNGAFGKRYGQNVFGSFPYKVHDVITFNDLIFAHAGTYIYTMGENRSPVRVGSGFANEKGLFIVYAQNLYYLDTSGFYMFSENAWSEVETYIPEVLINCRPDGSNGGDVVDEYNVLGTKIKLVYNGQTGVREYQVGVYDDATQKMINWDVTPTIEVEDTVTTAFTVDKANRKITFTTAPPEGNMNVVMAFTIKADTFADRKRDLLACRYYETFGGSNNSRLFLAGCGNSTYFWSEAYDISFFPEPNLANLGNTEEDITGFGKQYNVLMIFKPREIYSVYSYTQTSSTTIVEEDIGTEGFRTQLVNARIGCDAPYSIQLINNLLTWFNSKEGVCTLVSTNIQDERNVRTISRNIDRTNGFGVIGILDMGEDVTTIQSMDYDSKYFLAFPEHGLCYMWDYAISPYTFSSRGETDPKQLDWFLFDHFYVKQFLRLGKELLYASTNNVFNKNLVILNTDLHDLDFNGDGVVDGIEAYYMTPFLQFGAVEYLKTIKNMYIQSRGDTATKFDIFYYTEESGEPEEETESVNIGGRIWNRFLWSGFSWSMMFWGITYRIRCMLKKVQMASFFFRNADMGRDLSLTHIGLQYQLVKYLK